MTALNEWNDKFHPYGWGDPTNGRRG